MSKLLLVFIFLVSISSLHSSKPYCSFHIDEKTEVHFQGKCLINIEEDSHKKDEGYILTDIFKYEDGRKVFSFDCYGDRLQIRDTNDNIVFEHIYFKDYSKMLNHTIMLPFYDKEVVYYGISQRVDTNHKDFRIFSNSRLLFFKVDYSNDKIEAKYDETIINNDIAYNFLTATLSENGNSYHIASFTYDPVVFFSMELFSDGSDTFKRHVENFDPDFDENDPFFYYPYPNLPGWDMRFSPQGDRLIYNYYDSLFVFCSIDNNTGEYSLDFKVDFGKETGYYIRGTLEFSQDGTKLYAHSSNDRHVIHQFELDDYTKEGILNSRTEIWSTESDCEDCLFKKFQLAPNNRIYVSYHHNYTGKQDSTFLGVIECPNSKGISANYKHLSVFVSPYKIDVPLLHNIPTNFLKTPQEPTEIIIEKELELCQNSEAKIEGADVQCGEHKWKTPLNDEWVYSKDLYFEGITKEDEGVYYYSFQDCNQLFYDTIEVKLLDEINPYIIFINESDYCDSNKIELFFTADKKYNSYTWYYTETGSNSKSIISTDDTISVGRSGKLELVVLSESGCEGVAEYNIDSSAYEYKIIESEMEVKFCPSDEVYYTIKPSISFNNGLRIDSVKFKEGNNISILNIKDLVGDYPDGNLNKNTIVDINSNKKLSFRDTIIYYIYSDCYYNIEVPILVNKNTNSAEIEIPQLKGIIGERNFEIPIYLNTFCEIDEPFTFEATLYFSKFKYHISEIKGLNVEQKWQDSTNQYVRFRFDLNKIEKGKSKIGSLIGTLLLTKIDSTNISILEPVSNFDVELIDGSLVTDDICAQEFRQVNIISDVEISYKVDGRILEIDPHNSDIKYLKISIKDYIGKTIIENQGVTIISLSELSTGVYFLRIQSEFYTKSYKLLIE